MKPTITDAILALVPNAKFTTMGDKITLWESEENEPIKEDIEIKLTELVLEYDNKEYKRKRAIEYLSISEQLDLIYWDKKNGTNKWVEHIEYVKTKYPKGI